ncbi:MAG: autotransporter, partial [Phenylobacterium sp.]|nr:autotransporter [Phenylobacterium sp.]
MRLRHVLFAAASPLCLLAGAAQAESVISTTISTPVATATATNGAPDDVRVSSTGVVQPTAGAAITLNSNNKLTNEGTIKIQNANDATGILVLGGMT